MSKENNTNAVKHGAFAKMVIFPGEYLSEFEQFHNALIEEWRPDGPTEDAKVAALAQYMWQKRRLLRYRHNRIEELERRRDAIIEDDWKENKKLRDFLTEIESGSHDAITEPELLAKLQGVGADKLSPSSSYMQRLARKLFETNEAWLKAVVKDYDDLVDYWEFIFEKEQSTTVDAFLHNEKTMTEELELDKRLDAMIDKTVKSLCQIKAMKQISVRNQNAMDTTSALKSVASPAIQKY